MGYKIVPQFTVKALKIEAVQFVTYYEMLDLHVKAFRKAQTPKEKIYSLRG